MDDRQSHPPEYSLTPQTRSRILWSLGLTLAFVGIEATAGILARSLALLSDAGHNLTDAMSLALTWYAVRLSARPADANLTLGYHRAGILVALINSTTLQLESTECVPDPLFCDMTNHS
jgi:cobalt-zinc-cadmium efflux system protein